jgi:cytochrome c-type biogenesis protein
MTLALAFMAGVLSILSPCILPLVPIVLAGAVQQDKLGPLALMAGLVLTFTTTGMLFAVFGFGAGFDRDAIKMTAGVLMVVAGLLILFAQIQQRFIILAEPFFDRLRNLIAKFSAKGLAGQAMLGALLGVAWSPCAGPTLGAAIGLAMQKQSLRDAFVVILVFGIGAATPLLFLAYAGGYALGHRRNLAAIGRYAKPALGLFLLMIGGSIISGADKTVEIYLTKTMPTWLVDLTTRF